jgi:hypothetical protein
MSKSDEYRANAEECQKMARIATDPGEKATWLEMASDWLRMIQKADPTASGQFDAAEKAQGTNQVRSEGEH